jgi:hypothetical protein
VAGEGTMTVTRRAVMPMCPEACKRAVILAPIALSAFLAATLALAAGASDTLATARASRFVKFQAPAGDLPATRDTSVDGVQGAILPNGRFLTRGYRDRHPGPQALRTRAITGRRDPRHHQ